MAVDGQTALEERVLSFIQERHLVVGKSDLVVAVSGGPDSVCLLNILVNLQQRLGMRLHVAHLNHQLRGAEAEADARYVSELARKLGVPATIEPRDVKAYRRRHRLSLEEAAREVRYAFLARVAEAVGAESVAVGHTVDDHAETILMHLIRGAGTRGLRGLQPLNKWQSSGCKITVIRPLLEISREETADYCRQHDLNPCFDSSNLSLSPFRNRIRHRLLPLLRGYNPQVTGALLRTARIAADDLDFIDGEVARWWGKVARREGDTVILKREDFLKLPPSLKRGLFRASLESLLGNLKDIEAQHIEEMMEGLHKPAGKSINLPDGLILSIEYDKYLLGPDPAALSPFPVLETESPVKIPGKTKLPGWAIEAAITDSFKEKGTGLKDSDFTAFFDLDKVGKQLTVRPRKPGDRFQPLGMDQTKRLNEFMIDARVPRAWRPRIPVICSPDNIIWVVGWRIDERAKVTGATRRVLRLKMERVVGS